MEHTILILILPFLSFLILGLAGMRIYVQLSGRDGKMEEIAGSIKALEINEIMSIEILDYYTTTDNPIMFHDMILQRLTAYPDTKFALVQFDIKRFKLINENYGEDAGTEMLQFISRLLSRLLGFFFRTF